MRVKSLLFATGSLFCAVVQAANSNQVIFGYLPTGSLNANVDYSKYTHVALAFALPNQDGSLSFDATSSLPGVVANLKKTNTKTLVSIGGWTGSKYFSNILKDNSKRSNFLNSIVSLVKNNGLDGIDIDWEYPGHKANPGNSIDPQRDTSNFLAFLKDLRTALNAKTGSGKLITLAAATAPFYGPNGPLSDVSGFAGPVDYINLMTYDINGAWGPRTAPNSPLYYNPQPNTGAQVSFDSAIKSWNKAGIPSSKLLGGLAFYGHAFNTKGNMDTSNPVNQYADFSGTPDGDWTYASLRSTQGVLSGPTTANGPWVRNYDPITQTPWLFNHAQKIYVSYDDPVSIKAKRDYTLNNGVAGLMVWAINQDYNNELINA
ncbi:endochitinase, partial [Martensiomyces pterosporus]